jgi:hypothetical protein
MTKFVLNEWRDGGCPETYKIACELGPDLRFLSPSLLQRHLVITFDLAWWFIARMEFAELVERFEHPNGGPAWHWIGAPWEVEHQPRALMIGVFRKVR